MSIMTRHPWWVRVAVALLAAVLVVLSGHAMMSGVAGTGWGDVGALLGSLSHSRLAVLVIVWSVGLAGYASTVLPASLPGLGRRRSLLLNLSGSAVANLLPLGGAVATALNWRMVRSWGHSNGAFTAFCVLTNGLDVLTKLLLPITAVLALVVAGTQVPTPIWALAAGCLVVLAVGAGLLRRSVGRLAATTSELVRRRPVTLLAGSVGYLALQVLLLRLCLGACGLQPSLAVLLTCAALERVATLIPLTPAGAGFAELGAVAWLIASGLDPAGAVAGVLLYRVFVVGMELPVGAALLAGWALWWRRQGREAAR